VALLRLPEPYDFDLSTERYRAFGPDLANLWYEGGLHRVVGRREVRIEAAPGGVDVEPLDAGTEPAVRTLLGAGFDLDSFYEFARADPVLADLVATNAGLRPPLNPDPFETIVTAISAQQVSLRAAFAIRNRLIEQYGEPGVNAMAFPRPERLRGLAPDDLLALGFSRRKAEYIVELAERADELKELRSLPDEDVKARLVAMRGIGEWTADWFLARHLARPRAWPAGDLGLRKAVGAFYFGGRMPSIEETRMTSERVAPFENLSAHYLLAGLLGSTPAA
jgi:DNA-3-methyladenine glycosylase II